MNCFPLHSHHQRRTRLLAADRRCACCDRPACIQFGVTGPCYCLACMVRCLRLRRRKESHVRTHASTREGRKV
jgi:hypothetical protein